jgi:hypothetical protein
LLIAFRLVPFGTAIFVLQSHITLIMRRYISVGLAAILTSQAIAGDGKWLSPVYTEIYQNPLPFPPDKGVT